MMTKSIRIAALCRQLPSRHAPKQKSLRLLSRAYSSNSTKPAGSIVPLVGLTALLSMLGGYGLATQFSPSPVPGKLTPVQYPQKAGMLSASPPNGQSASWHLLTHAFKAAHEISSVLGEDAVSYDSDNIESHGFSDWSASNSEGRAVAIVYPRSTEDVSKIATICSKHSVPMGEPPMYEASQRPLSDLLKWLSEPVRPLRAASRRRTVALS